MFLVLRGLFMLFGWAFIFLLFTLLEPNLWMVNFLFYVGWWIIILSHLRFLLNTRFYVWTMLSLYFFGVICVFCKTHQFTIHIYIIPGNGEMGFGMVIFFDIFFNISKPTCIYLTQLPVEWCYGTGYKSIALANVKYLTRG